MVFFVRGLGELIDDFNVRALVLRQVPELFKPLPPQRVHPNAQVVEVDLVPSRRGQNVENPQNHHPSDDGQDRPELTGKFVHLQ